MAPLSLTVDTAHGPVTGFADTHPLSLTSPALDPNHASTGNLVPVNKWLGIPYAHAARWKRPTDPQPWTDPKQCFDYGSAFPQPGSNTEMLLARLPGFLMRAQKTSEDSHFINVYAPGDVQEGEKLPVLVWVYGGALNNGSADRFFYDATELVRASAARGQRCLVVTGNYRTNVFGFCAHDDLAQDDPNGLCGNYGLYDVVKMFEWVQANVSSFGGDPARVTAFGQSAGAFIISHLLVSGKRLFTRAICQSGAANTMMLRPVDKAYPAYASILSSLGLTSSSSPSARLAALRSTPASTLLSLHTAAHNFSGLSLTLEPRAAEGAVWTEDSMARLKRGEWDEWIEGVVLGTTADEGTIFAQAMNLLTPEAFTAYTSQFPSSLRPRIAEKYLAPFGGLHPSTPSVPLTALPGSRLLADQIFVHPVWDQACALSSPPASSRGHAPTVWLYRLETGVSSLLEHPVAKHLGIMHSMDLPFVFDSSTLWTGEAASGREEQAREDGRTAEEVGTRWVTFACEGNPDPAWPQFSPTEPQHLVFSHGGATRTESLADFARDKLELFFEGHEREGAGEEVLGKTDE
ncbi:uncharacterized protein JCM10292_005326 [Rhodotorula paludigena]|uniref:uncharacterized protein n=1 Tax=Rhodotorula paludigena TaxID=86838 RepID=UPI0031805C68